MKEQEECNVSANCHFSAKLWENVTERLLKMPTTRQNYQQLVPFCGDRRLQDERILPGPDLSAIRLCNRTYRHSAGSHRSHRPHVPCELMSTREESFKDPKIKQTSCAHATWP